MDQFHHRPRSSPDGDSRDGKRRRQCSGKSDVDAGVTGTSSTPLTIAPFSSDEDDDGSLSGSVRINKGKGKAVAMGFQDDTADADDGLYE